MAEMVRCTHLYRHSIQIRNGTEKETGWCESTCTTISEEHQSSYRFRIVFGGGGGCCHGRADRLNEGVKR